jgi:hypothetical protein
MGYAEPAFFLCLGHTYPFVGEQGAGNETHRQLYQSFRA